MADPIADPREVARRMSVGWKLLRDDDRNAYLVRRSHGSLPVTQQAMAVLNDTKKLVFAGYRKLDGNWATLLKLTAAGRRLAGGSSDA